MALPVNITDPSGLNGASVVDGALVVTGVLRATSQAEAQRVKVLTGLLSTPGGVTAMAVDGSTTPVEFSLNATSDTVLRILEMRLVFHATTMDIIGVESRRFGPATAAKTPLPNGLELRVTQEGVTTQLFLTPVKVIGEFYRYSGSASGGISSGIVSDKDAVDAGIDLLVVQIVMPTSLALYPGTIDNITLIVNDDLTSLDLFETQFYGTVEPQ